MPLLHAPSLLLLTTRARVVCLYRASGKGLVGKEESLSKIYPLMAVGPLWPIGEGEVQNVNQQEITLHPVESTSISALGYDAGSETLAVQFRDSGSIYYYSEVDPEVYTALRMSQSKGAFVNRRIKNHPYQRIA